MNKFENITIDWEKPPCSYCGSVEREHVITSFDYEIENKFEFTVVRCRKCGLHYTCPRPTIEHLIQHFYPDDYNCYRYKDSVDMSDQGMIDRIFDERTNSPRLRRLEKHFNDRIVSLLDVGSGDGSLLKYLTRKTNWELRGVEPKEAIAESLRRSGLTIDCGLLEDIHYSDSSFDAVTLTHVIEHVENPKLLLHEINRILKPNGVLLLEIPDLDALDRRLFGRFWWGYHLPRHTTHFNLRTIEMLGSDAGFTKISSRHYLRAGPMSWNLHIFVAKSRLPVFKYFSKFFSLRNPLLLLAALPLEAINIIFGKGNLLEVFFLKNDK